MGCLRAWIACGLALALSLGCGSDTDEPEADSAAEDLWAPHPEKPAQGRGPARDPAPPPDPDEVVARYEKVCAGGGASAECAALRRDLELVFLSDLVGLRSGGQRIDRELARTAARAENPRLACFGLREMLLARELTSEDEGLIAAALDSRWRAPREVVRSLGRGRAQSVRGLADLFARDSGTRTAPSAHLCLGGARDPEPNPGLAGRYPGARYRPFASDSDLRWFTTSDSPKKVLAFLTRGGKPAQTLDELKAEQQATYLAESEKIFANAGPDDDVMLPVIELQFRAGRDWGQPVEGLEGVGEIRYVMITPDQAIAVFRDDVLDATSIVASRPAVFDPKAFGL